jgi:transcription elongation factor Elf1
MASVLVVTCKSCGNDFESPIQADPTSFETMTLTNNTYSCPRCGAANAYDKEDHRFARDSE